MALASALTASVTVAKMAMEATALSAMATGIIRGRIDSKPIPEVGEYDLSPHESIVRVMNKCAPPCTPIGGPHTVTFSGTRAV